MEDAIASGFGGEKGDQVLKVATVKRPLWTLNPLPLAQVNPDVVHRVTRRGPAKSLQHTCLSVISKSFHLYTPSSFDGLPQTITERVFHKVRHDRMYDMEGVEGETPSQPDQATIWALSMFADPETADESHTLALPVEITLQHLKPHPTFANPIHPLVEIPQIYSTIQPDTGFKLITTLQLDGLNDLVSDQNIISLKYATHLTVLRMTGCRRVTDRGIGMLAASLKLPGKDAIDEGRGMWRLRAWFLYKCRGLGDKSMASFARWPGLVLLDVRSTSVTTTGITIFNRQCETIFSSKVAHMQPCSSGLMPLFGPITPSSTLVDLLAQTLLIPGNGPSRTSLVYRSLNIIPSHTAIDPEHLPYPVSTSSGAPRATSYTRTDTSRYLAGGYGTLYGSGVSNLEDKVQSFRKDVSTALYMQALAEGLVEEPDEDDGKWWDKSKKSKKKKANVYKEKKDANERSKAFYTANQKKMESADGTNEVRGHTKMMMVRVAQQGWEELSWTLTRAPVENPAEPTPALLQRRKVDIVGQLLGVTASSQPAKVAPRPATSTTSAAVTTKKPPPPPGSNLFRPVKPAAQPNRPPPKPMPVQSTAPSLTSSQSSGVSSQASLAGPSQTMSTPRAPSNPFAASSASGRPSLGFGVKPLSSSPAGPGSSDVDDFASSGKKRSWGGVSEESVKRRGMKMFSRARM